MDVVVCSSAVEVGRRAAQYGAQLIRTAIAERGSATVIVATCTSQFETLAALISEPGIDWGKVTGFHLDEYLGLPMSHPASFRGYLKQRLFDKVPIGRFHFVHGQANPANECARLSNQISGVSVDVAFIGIGDNGHLTFKDPPADFETDEPYLVVDLDETCRRQQLEEGQFSSLDAVPRRAISMSVHQLLKSREIVCSVPDERKAAAVRAAVEGPVTPAAPASILQTHASTTMYLDPPAASLLTNRL